MLLGDVGFCTQTANIWLILGYVVMVFKLIVPLLLIIFGMVDLGKAVVSSEEKAISKSVNTLIRRFIAAVIIFFIPTIVSAVLSAVGLVKNDNGSDYHVCLQCVVNMDAGTTYGNETHSCKEWAKKVTGEDENNAGTETKNI